MKNMTPVSVVLALLVFVTATTLRAQSNPTPFDLNTGTYSLTDWLSTSPAGTYPPSMVFQQTTKQHRLINHLVTQALQGARQLVECQIGIRADHIEIKSELVHVRPC